MQILYISTSSSERLINQIHQSTGCNPGYAMQKFNRLLIKGLMSSGATVSTLSNPPITRSLSSKFIIRLKKEEENSITYRYVPVINIPIVKHLFVILYAFFFVLLWGIKGGRYKTIICDVLNVSVCLGALLATKVNRVQSVGIVTDIYGLMVGSSKNRFNRFISSCAHRIHDLYVTSYDKYVLLTEQMNERVNPKGKPYIVMEALCDSSLLNQEHSPVHKVNPRTVLYAGGLHAKYGVKMLVEGFIKADLKEVNLVLYGSGSYEKELLEVCRTHSNVEFRGVAPNETVMEEELKATLLVNPRFSTEEFTKYSFPSKNMEYMASGTPLLTTKLPGMPIEYYPHVYLFEEETIEGYAKTIKDILSLPADELQRKGSLAKQFVLENKNNVSQAERIVAFLKTK